MDYLRSQGRIVAIVDCTRRLFQPHTDTKTNVVVFEKPKTGQEKAGAIQRCLFVGREDMWTRQAGGSRQSDPMVGPTMTSPSCRRHFTPGIRPIPHRLGFMLQMDDLDPYYLVPRYYSPEVTEVLQKFAQTTKADLVSISDLIKAKKIQISKGHEVGSDAYGTGAIPFIRTSDIANLEITHDPTFGVSDAVYEPVRGKAEPSSTGHPLRERWPLQDRECVCADRARHEDCDPESLPGDSLTRPRPTRPISLAVSLWAPRRQVASRVEARFIQSTIATLGARLKELVLPVPKDQSAIQETISALRRIVTQRAELRAEAQKLNRADGVEL